MNNPLKYSNVWEDASLLSKALQIDSNSKVMSIASAGDNSLFLLKDQPKAMVCIDLNDIQIFVSELKEQAIRYLEYVDCLMLLGFENCTKRWALYQVIEPFLSEAAQRYFSENKSLVEKGIIHQGKFERYFKIFAKWVLPFIHSKKTIEQLFATKTEAEQKAFYQNKWNTRSWRLLFNLFFSRKTMGKLGREPEKLKEVKGDVGELIFEKAEKHLQSKEAQSNAMLQYCLTGKFGNFLPPYVQKNNFDQIKQWLQTNQITYFHGDLQQAMAQFKNFNRFNLSNIFEYMNERIFKTQTEMVFKQSAKDSIVAYWNLMVSRKMDAINKFIYQPKPMVDLGFFYSNFLTYTKS